MKPSPVELCTVRSLRAGIEETFPFSVFLYVLQGEADVLIGTETVTHMTSDLLFLPCGRRLHIRPTPKGQLLLFGLSNSFIADYLRISPLPFLSSVLAPEDDYLPLKRTILKTAEYAKGSDPDDSSASGEAEELELVSLLFHLLSCFSRLLPRHGITDPKARHAERMQEIADYIDLHYPETFSLSDLAEAFFLTPQYLSTFFKDHFKTSFKSYLTTRRLYFAQRDLRGSSGTINEIALKNGFPSVSTFQKNFRRYCGCTPSEYREKCASEHERAASEASFPAGAEEEIPGKSISGAIPGLSIAARTDRPVSDIPHVNRMINVGSVRSVLSEAFRAHLLAFCRKTGIRYIRITELLSNGFMPMILPHREYFYQNADIVLSFFYENDLIPFIELTKIEKNRRPEVSLQGEYNYVLRTDRFFRLLESFLKHVTRRWPASWLGEWKFEMWMLPKDTPLSYTGDFARAAGLIHTYIPAAAVGGFGYDGTIHKIHAEEILKEFRKHHLTPDFFSASLHYRIRLPDGSIALSRDKDHILNVCRELKKSLAACGLELPLFITEWTAVDSGETPAPASRYQAAFIARTWQALDRVSDLAAYDLFDDTEYYFGTIRPSIYHFGRGLFTSSFIPYAAYHAFMLCASLGTGVIAEGHSWRLVRAEENHLQLLAWHYVHFRASSDPEAGGIISFDLVYSMFEDEPSLPFSAVLTGLTPGLYHITRTVIDETHGSILDVLINEYKSSNIDRIEFLQHARTLSGSPRLRPSEIEEPAGRRSYTRIRNDTLTLSTLLEPHAVCLWDIRRLI